jgi:hypothetical protein
MQGRRQLYARGKLSVTMIPKGYLPPLVQELASEAIKAEQAAIDKQNLFAAQGAGATEVCLE